MSPQIIMDVVSFKAETPKYIRVRANGLFCPLTLEVVYEEGDPVLLIPTIGQEVRDWLRNTLRAYTVHEDAIQQVINGLFPGSEPVRISEA